MKRMNHQLAKAVPALGEERTVLWVVSEWMLVEDSVTEGTGNQPRYVRRGQ